MTTATLQQVPLTPLPQALKSDNQKLYTFKQYEGVAILRLSRTEFWVHDTVHKVGIVMYSWDSAQEVLKQLAQDF